MTRRPSDQAADMKAKTFTTQSIADHLNVKKSRVEQSTRGTGRGGPNKAAQAQWQRRQNRR